MVTCPACTHENGEGVTFCGRCGTWLDVPAATGDAAAGAGHRTHPALAAVAILGLGAVAAATAYRVVTRPGRELPPRDEKLRALRGPPAPVDDEARFVAPDRGVALDAGRPDAGRSRLAKRAPRRRRRRTRRPTGKTPAKRPAVPRPTRQAIRACINQHRGPLRRCLERSALRMEPPPGGVGRAVLQPDGKLVKLSVPGGRYFSSCVKSVLIGVRCRAFEGAPIDVSYPLRW